MFFNTGHSVERYVPESRPHQIDWKTVLIDYFIDPSHSEHLEIQHAELRHHHLKRVRCSSPYRIQEVRRRFRNERVTADIDADRHNFHTYARKPGEHVRTHKLSAQYFEADVQRGVAFVRFVRSGVKRRGGVEKLCWFKYVAATSGLFEESHVYVSRHVRFLDVDGRHLDAELPHLHRVVVGRIHSTAFWVRPEKKQI